jgi:hypothetical protein
MKGFSEAHHTGTTCLRAELAQPAPPLAPAAGWRSPPGWVTRAPMLGPGLRRAWSAPLQGGTACNEQELR